MIFDISVTEIYSEDAKKMQRKSGETFPRFPRLCFFNILGTIKDNLGESLQKLVMNKRKLILLEDLIV